MGGKRKAQEGEKMMSLSVPTAAVFLSGTGGLSLEWPWQVKKKRKKERKKERKKRKKKQDF